jgi:hypothetical protein
MMASFTESFSGASAPLFFRIFPGFQDQASMIGEGRMPGAQIPLALASEIARQRAKSARL